MNNTKIMYRYKPENGKTDFNYVVVSGVMSEEEKDELMQSLKNGATFIPDQIGLKSLSRDTEDDTVWHFIRRDEILPTMERPSMDIPTLLKKFHTIWDASAATRKLFADESGGSPGRRLGM